MYSADKPSSGWTRHAVAIGSQRGAMVILEAELGSGTFGHMAIDDVSFHNCALFESVPGTCNFEHGSCGYKEFIINDDFNWQLQQGN